MNDFNDNFKPVRGLLDYGVTRDGKIFSKKHGRWKELKGGKDKDGYRKVILCNYPHKRIYARLHILILEAFVGPCPEGMEGCHGSGGLEDNSVANLRWDFHKNNILDKKLAGTWQSEEKHPMALLNTQKVKCIKDKYKLYNGKKTSFCVELGKELGVSWQAIYAIISGKNWANV